MSTARASPCPSGGEPGRWRREAVVLLDKEGIWSPPVERVKAARELADRLDQLGTWPVQVARLRQCGSHYVVGGDGRPVVLFCDQRFCPVCRPRWQGISAWNWWPKITRLYGPRGGVMAGTLTQPPGGGTLLEQKRAIRRRVSKIFDRRRWKGPHGFMHKVGILLVIEIGTEGAHVGLPHVHVLVVSPEVEVAQAAMEWIRDVWLELNPDASPQGQHHSACDGRKGFDAWLGYLLKGCTLAPAWDDDRLEAMVQTLTDGSHRLSSYGLLRTPRSKPRRKARARPRPERPEPVSNDFGHETVDTRCREVSTVAEEKTSTVDNFSRVSSCAFGLDRSYRIPDPEPNMTIHPRPGEHGKPVTIKHPHTPTPLATWSNPTAVATVVPDGPMPPMINDVPLIPHGGPIPDRADWERRAREMDFEEPPFDAEGKPPAAGAVVVEPDGRLWLVSPTNEFGQYKNAFPKGKAHGMSLKATALKEVFEEAGLQVELFEHLLDVTKTTSRTRYYLARRTGGHPAAMCWESQAVHLVPLEKVKGLLNQSVDHQVTDALIEKWGSWAAWFFRRDGDDPSWEAAKSGRIPASRKDWLTLPLPAQRARIALDIRLDAHEAQNLKLGFVPRMMEQKWFAYFEGETLYEHRSWTGFCISETHFEPEGDGLRATYAEVNRQTGQYECTDDAEDARLLTERIRQLAHLTEEDRNAEDPFVAGLKASMVPNYLGDPKVVGRLVEGYFQAVLDQHVASIQGGDVQAAHAAFMDQNKTLARIFAGEDPSFQTIGTWNSVGSLGALAINTLDLDPAYYADENLFCILSEGLAGVAICLREMTTAFEADPQAEFSRDFLPQIQRLAQFTASVLMGTQAVLFPELSLRSFTYVQANPQPKVPGLFDTPMDRDNTQEEEQEEGQDDEDMNPDEIDELRIAFGLAPLNGKSAHGTEGLFEPPLNKTGRPITLPGPIGALAKKVGGVGALADELGVSPRTIRRWAMDGVIPKMGLKVLNHLFKQHAVDPEGLVDAPVEE